MRLITVLASLYLYQYQHVYRLGIRKYLDVPSIVTIINLVRQDVGEFTSLYLRKKLSFAQKYSVTVFFTEMFFSCRGYPDKLENYRDARGWV